MIRGTTGVLIGHVAGTAGRAEEPVGAQRQPDLRLRRDPRRRRARPADDGADGGRGRDADDQRGPAARTRWTRLQPGDRRRRGAHAALPARLPDGVRGRRRRRCGRLGRRRRQRRATSRRRCSTRPRRSSSGRRHTIDAADAGRGARPSGDRGRRVHDRGRRPRADGRDARRDRRRRRCAGAAPGRRPARTRWTAAEHAAGGDARAACAEEAAP